MLLILTSRVFAQGGGYALDFDGVNDYVNLPDFSYLNDLSFSAWFKIDTRNTWERIFDFGRGNSGDIFLTTKGGRTGGDLELTIHPFGGTYTIDPGVTCDDGQWHHVAFTYDKGSAGMVLYIDGQNMGSNSYNTYSLSDFDSGQNFYLGKANWDDPYYDGKMDEVRVWNASLTQSQIQAWMHKPIDTNHGNYSNSTSDNLKAYYQMSNGSGTSLTDNSANSNTGTLTNMDNNDWVTSYAPISTLNSSYTTDVEALWSASGTSASDASNGLSMTVSSTLAEANFAVFGNNNSAGTTIADVPSGVEARSARIWQVDESGTVAADVTIDISDVTDYTVTAGTASNYKLLYRSGTSGDFSTLASGSSKSGDAVTFSSVSISDGYLAIGQATDSDAYLTPYVTISGNAGFRMMSSFVAGTIYDDILDPLWIQGMTGADDTNGDANVWTYDPSGSGSWDALTNISTASLTAGKGFLVYVFTDVDNDGDDDISGGVKLNVNGTENSALSVNTTASKYNLLGNPFNVTIDADQLFSDNGTTNWNSVVYVWNDAASDYYEWNGSAGDLSNGLIAPYQGFWVEAKSGGTSYSFTANSRSGSTGTFYKTASDSSGSMYFTITAGDKSDNMFVSFMDNGSQHLDPADADKLLPMSTGERVVGVSYAENNSLGINNLPYAYAGTISIPLDVIYLTVDDGSNFVTQEETVTMTWDLNELPEHITMTLTDNTTNSIIDLTQQSELTFTTVAKGSFPSWGNEAVSIYPELGSSHFTVDISYSELAMDNTAGTLPIGYALHQNYPNPFNPTTTLRYDIPENSHVTITIYDMLGRKVRTILNLQQDPGYKSLIWNATNDYGKPVSAGMYLYQIQAGEYISTKKMVLLK